MTRRSTKNSSHVHRVQTTTTMTFTTTNNGTNGKTTTMTNTNQNGFHDVSGRDLLYRKHQLLRRATSFMLARKYRAPWHSSSSEYSNNSSTRTRTMSSVNKRTSTVVQTNRSPCRSSRKVCTMEELLNFWKDLPSVGKRTLLRIHRDVYLTALDHYLVCHHLCCECHDNVIAEWEDHERRRSSSRALQDVFSVFPPYLDEDDDDEEDDEEYDDEEEDEEEFEEEEEEDAQGRLINREDVLIDEEDLVFKYDLYRDEFRRANEGGNSSSSHCTEHSSHEHSRSNHRAMSDEYMAALEVGKRQEDELLRLIQKEERYIIIREDHSEFIMDLIRCGEQFSFEPMSESTSSSSNTAPVLEYGEMAYDEEDDIECPGANTSYLAQEYLLEVLAIKFREQLENAYQAALQHSLAVQAELLRDEIAALQQQNEKSSSSKRKKDKKKKKKKTEATTSLLHKESTSSMGKENNTKKDVNTKLETNEVQNHGQPVVHEQKKPEKILELSPGEKEEEEKGQEVDREVEQFRLLLEKINTNHTPRSKPKLVLPPGAFINTISAP